MVEAVIEGSGLTVAVSKGGNIKAFYGVVCSA